MSDAQEIYTSTVSMLPREERLRLAELILNDTATQEGATEEAAEHAARARISDDEFKAAREMLFDRYSHTLQRLAE